MALRFLQAIAKDVARHLCWAGAACRARLLLCPQGRDGQPFSAAAVGMRVAAGPQGVDAAEAPCAFGDRAGLGFAKC